MQFGMPTLIENKTLEDNIALCRRLGLRFIELNMNFPEYQLAQLGRTDLLLRLAEQAGIYYTIHLDENLNVADFNPLVSKAYLQTVERTIGAAKRLCILNERFGDPARPLIVNMHMHHGIHVTLPDKKVPLYERDFETYMQSFSAFRDLCEEWIGSDRIMISIENTDGFRDFEKKAIAYLLQSPVFGLTWDIGHSKAAKEKDVPFLLDNEAQLVHFHIHDGRQTPPQNHLALGDGEIDLQQRLSLAQSLQARCVLETKTVSALELSVQWLRSRGYLAP